MTNKSTILLPLLILMSAFILSPINAAEAPSSIEYQGTELMLNGQGTQIKTCIINFHKELYTGTLTIQH